MTPLAQRIRELRRKLKLSQAAFGERIGVSQPTVSRWEKGEDAPEDHHLEKMAALGNTSALALRYGVADPSVHTAFRIPVVGYVGVGEEVTIMENIDENQDLEYVEVPPEVAEEGLAALRIRGDAMRPLRNGWKVYYLRDQEGVPAEALNQLCVVELADGRVLLKELRRGSEPYRFTLLSWNANVDPIENAEVVAASPVKAIIPG